MFYFIGDFLDLFLPVLPHKFVKSDRDVQSLCRQMGVNENQA